jgi:hypothetical protein
MRCAVGRRLATLGPLRARIGELESAAPEEDEPCPGTDLAALRRRAAAIPFIDTFDLRYNHRDQVDAPSSRAVMFCLMDVSGSMDEAKKNMAKRFFTLLYLFLKRNYERTEVVFIRHHTVAEEVDEERFFHSRESGGTVVSTALKLMLKVIGERYAPELWNIYGAQASDGDNWQEDSSICVSVLGGRILPAVRHFAYVEIAETQPQSLWREYEAIQSSNPGRFAMRRVNAPGEIWPVFHDLFRKRA